MRATIFNRAALRVEWVCIILGTMLVGFASAADVPTTAAAPDHPFVHPPAWVADQTLYEVNLRSFSADATIEAFRKDLPRLESLGVGTIWFMPIQPVGVLNHAGKLGSPYAVADFKAFNPEFGTIDQFKATVDEAHRLGMHVIIDWVAGHTALDHPWITAHPDWYKHDAQGKLVHPMADWLDVAALDYSSTALRAEMLDSMAWWVTQTGIDGFRCDSAEFVPVDFWVQMRDVLRKIKPVFLLAEGNNPELVKYAFDAAYAWYLPDNTKGIAKGTKSATDLMNFFKAEAGLLTGDGFRLNYVTNHDVDGWEGTPKELLGDSVDAFTVLTFTAPGMPLIYNGQEAGLDQRLNFFEHDPIKWHDDPKAALYQTLAELKRNNRALWDGLGTGRLQFVAADCNASVLTFQREFSGDRVVVMLNLSSKPTEVPTPPGIEKMRVVLGERSSGKQGLMTLEPWSYHVWSSTP